MEISKDEHVNKNKKIKDKQTIQHWNKKSKQKPNKHYSGVLGDYNIEESLLEQVLFFMIHGLQWRPTLTLSSSALPGYG
jgi:hypothetical protein